jgi:hypothetical protein
MVSRNVGSNALKFAGEVVLPGASQLLDGNVTSGVVHAFLGVATGVALVGTGIAPLIGTLAIIGIKLNSYASSVTSESLSDGGRDAARGQDDRTPPAGGSPPPAGSPQALAGGAEQAPASGAGEAPTTTGAAQAAASGDAQAPASGTGPAATPEAPTREPRGRRSSQTNTPDSDASTGV